MGEPAIMSPELREAREKLKRFPVHSVSDLFTLDPDEIEEGYKDAREGLRCGDNQSRAYWHGWRNGMIDAGKMEPDEWSALLIRDMQSRGLKIMDVAAEHRKQFAWLKSMGLA